MRQPETKGAAVSQPSPGPMLRMMQTTKQVFPCSGILPAVSALQMTTALLIEPLDLTAHFQIRPMQCLPATATAPFNHIPPRVGHLQTRCNPQAQLLNKSQQTRLYKQFLAAEPCLRRHKLSNPALLHACPRLAPGCACPRMPLIRGARLVRCVCSPIESIRRCLQLVTPFAGCPSPAALRRNLALAEYLLSAQSFPCLCRCHSCRRHARHSDSRGSSAPLTRSAYS